MLQKEIKGWVFEAYLLTKETSSRFLLIGSLKMTYARSYTRRSWIFIKRRGCELFFEACLTRLSKITVTCLNWVKRTKYGKFWFALIYQNKYQLWNAQSQQNKNLHISSHGEARNIKFGHLINIIERFPLGTLSQVVVMSLAHVHLTNLFISSYSRTAAIKFKK